MNTYQEIVNSVQANILVPVTQLEEKNTLREKLDRELEEFFAKGGKPKVLAMGETEYRDGKVPMRSAQKKKDIVVVETPSEVILEKNKAIKEAKTQAVQKTKVKAWLIAEKKRKRIAKQVEILSEFYSKANKMDYSILASRVGLTTRQLRDSTKSRELTDGETVLLIHEIKSFEYYVKPKRIRVSKPKKRRVGDSADTERVRRAAVNLAKHEAVSRGLSHFTAICTKHGETEYIVIKGNFHRCLLCKTEAAARSHSKNIQSKEKKVNHSRKLRNRASMNDAKNEGKNNFIGECLKHGQADFLIYENPMFSAYKNASPWLYKCNVCKAENRLKMEERQKALRAKAKEKASKMK